MAAVMAGADRLGPVVGLGYGRPSSREALISLSDGGRTVLETAVAEEVPVAFVYNGRSHAVMMCTPTDLDDLAFGFTLTEEIVADAASIRLVEIVRYSKGIELQIEIAAEASERLGDRRRSIPGRSGCGLCGVEAIDDALRESRHVATTLAVAPEALWCAGAALVEHQPLNRETNAVHAAAWAAADGTLRVVREDVGRHNALDKVVGALAAGGTNARDGFIVITSRASYELVQKAAVAGVELLAAVSRPTALAIRLADAAGMTLVGLLRGRTANIYTHAERLRAPAPPLPVPQAGD